LDTASCLAYLNGDFLQLRDAHLALNDAGFVMGATITDFCRTFRHRLFRWPDHLKRLRDACLYSSILLTRSDEEITAIAENLIAHNGRLLASDEELALISFATPGPIGYYLGDPGGAGDGSPTFGMHTFPLPMRRYRHFFEEGVSLAIAGWQPLGPRGTVQLCQVKHRSRLHWWLANRDLRKRQDVSPHALALLLSPFDNDVTETAIGNLLVVEDGAVITPPQDQVLEGISRRFVYLLCQESGIPFAESVIHLDSLREADEAMLCGTAFCLAGVREIDGHAIPWPGPVFEKLLAAWSAQVGLDIRRQILSSR
jgi:branched-chain amino acid aminotransferase